MEGVSIAAVRADMTWLIAPSNSGAIPDDSVLVDVPDTAFDEEDMDIVFCALGKVP